MLTSYLSVCEEAARSAGAVLRKMLGNVSVRHKKNPFDLVTEADIAAQKIIESIVLGHFPDHAFLGEEGYLTPLSRQTNKSESNGLCWIADPLDGTTNFVHGVPLFGPSIALTQGNDVLCGVFYNPMIDEFFSAAKGTGAFLNGQRLQTSSRQIPEESLISVSFPTQVRQDTPDLAAFLRAVPVCQAIRRTGSTALNLAYVAAGRFDATWTFTCHPWDIAAGCLLVREAGGMITKPDGSPVTFSDPSPVFAAAGEPLHRELGQLLL
ncbi:MAG: inositol monophosphatase [Planctomycetaceae bacterium]|jgi:myo-inositol-1(or 4)-monophosphatase|nr:inositol monophosphatase [Planctomycetaceae bacterium]